MYFYGAGVTALAGKGEAGLVTSRILFGDTGVTLVTLLILYFIMLWKMDKNMIFF
jgi:hypothetical protein